MYAQCNLLTRGAMPCFLPLSSQLVADVLSSSRNVLFGLSVRCSVRVDQAAASSEEQARQPIGYLTRTAKLPTSTTCDDHLQSDQTRHGDAWRGRRWSQKRGRSVRVPSPGKGPAQVRLRRPMTIIHKIPRGKHCIHKIHKILGAPKAQAS